MGKYLITILITIGLLAGLSACKKEVIEFTVNGVITDKSFDQPLYGATVNLKAVESGSSEVRDIGSQTTGSDGSYSFTFERVRDVKFYLTVEKDDYFPLDKTIFFSNLSVEEENTYSYNTYAKSFVQFHIKNTGNQFEDDNLKVEIIQAKSDCDECCGLGQKFFPGAYVDTTFACANNGNKYFKFIYWPPQSLSAEFDSLITVPFQTTDYYIEY